MFRLAIIGLTLGVAVTSHAAPPPVTYQSQLAESRDQAVAYLASGSPHGPVIRPGVDQYVLVDGRPVQLVYLACVGDPEARWFEDGSSDCLR